MRDDISKILVTTPRIGSWRKNDEVLYRRRERITEDYDGPTRCSMRPKNPRGRWTERKMLNEYLNPLERYIAKQVGRRWDDVYSDICRNNSRGSAVGEHIFQHLFDYVRVNGTDVSRWIRWDYFVDDDGILRRSPPRESRVRRVRPDGWRPTDDDLVWHVRNDDGCWFEWTLTPCSCELFCYCSSYLRRVVVKFSDGLPDKIAHRGSLRTLSHREAQACKSKAAVV